MGNSLLVIILCKNAFTDRISFQPQNESGNVNFVLQMGKQSDLPMGHVYWIVVLELGSRSKSSTFSTWKTHHFHQRALTHVHQITSTVSADHTLDTFWAGSSSGQNQNGFTFLCWRESNVSLKAKGNFAWGRISKSAWPNTMGLMINGPAWFTVILKQSLFSRQHFVWESQRRKYS